MTIDTVWVGTLQVEILNRFEVWFGLLFLGLGMTALLIAGVLFAALKRTPHLWAKRWAFLSAPFVIGLIFSTVGLSYAGYGLWQHGIEQGILASGKTVHATVTIVEQTYTRVNGRYLWRVRYQYADGAGGLHTGASGLLDAREARTWRPGDQGFVRYDVARPGLSVWLGRTDRMALRSRPTYALHGQM